MAINMKTIKGLTAIFRRLGAPRPEGWARSQIEEGIPQLGRFLFLKLAWQGVVKEGDSSWIEANIAYAKKDPFGPHAGAGHALASLRAKGATDEELTDLVRCSQAEMLYHFCMVVDDSYSLLQDLDPELAEEIGFTVAQTDGEENLVAVLPGLHESVLDMDPEGREVRPRGWVPGSGD
jgi:hypothetical protein